MAPSLTELAPPEWNEIQLLPAQRRLELLVLWLESILHAIEQDHGEPDTSESLCRFLALSEQPQCPARLLGREGHLSLAARLC